MTNKANAPILKGEINEIWGKSEWKNLFNPTDNATLILFRVLFGSILFWEVTRYFKYDWIDKYWISPKYHLTYWPFDFLEPLPGDGMYYLFYVLGVLTIFITIGFAYRISITLFFIGFSYSFLLEQTRYLNHFYLVILVCFVMIFLPLNRAFSIDSIINKKIKSQTAPLWCLWLVKFMIGIPYFFGGIAKINYDWLHGEPLTTWLSNDTDFPIIGPFFTEKWMTLSMSYTGLFLDLFIIPLLLFKKTRIISFIFVLSFHLMNSQLFNIGIFPWFMIASTSLYFNSSWPRNLYNTFSLQKNKRPLLIPLENTISYSQPLNSKQKTITISLIFWFILHVTLPLRHFIIPGNSNWTEEGHRYAWHMKLRTKRGMGFYTIVNKQTGEEIKKLNPAEYLEDWQLRKMAGRPYLIHAFCKMVAKEYKENGLDVAIYGNVIATLNGRKYQDLIKNDVDLASQPRPYLPPANWIIPLTTPLEDRLD